MSEHILCIRDYTILTSSSIIASKRIESVFRQRRFHYKVVIFSIARVSLKRCQVNMQSLTFVGCHQMYIFITCIQQSQQLVSHAKSHIQCPSPLGGSIKRRCCRTSVCLSRTSDLSREQRGLGRLKLAQR